ncbi:hypothetical protein MIND_01278600 [Mycena indigotica]|uniref:Uncharacterized protein n=1 Tax=Mycena indigotica TaxID=2126181 RepID=A0A8H6S3G3_9AGAR|nr:uncharacterized protein MIND_01278600 [Mycena indigotica]KAF7291341.1 hypothetical protein MIND_01278600 [Mycena indigotica]
MSIASSADFSRSPSEDDDLLLREPPSHEIMTREAAFRTDLPARETELAALEAALEAAWLIRAPKDDMGEFVFGSHFCKALSFRVGLAFAPEPAQRGQYSEEEVVPGPEEGLGRLSQEEERMTWREPTCWSFKIRNHTGRSHRPGKPAPGSGTHRICSDTVPAPGPGAPGPGDPAGLPRTRALPYVPPGERAQVAKNSATAKLHGPKRRHRYLVYRVSEMPSHLRLRAASEQRAIKKQLNYLEKKCQQLRAEHKYLRKLVSSIPKSHKELMSSITPHLTPRLRPDNCAATLELWLLAQGLLLLLYMAQLFYCQPHGPCPKYYDSKKAHDIHQRTCSSFNDVDEGLEAALALRKRQRLEEEQASALLVAEDTMQHPVISQPPNSVDPQLDVVSNTPLPAHLHDPPTDSSQSNLGRPARKKRLTWKLLQQLPEPPASLPDIPEEDTENVDNSAPPNNFGLFREYLSIPSHNPDTDIILSDLSDLPAPVQPNRQPDGETRLSPLSTPPAADALASAKNSGSYGPFGNYTVWGFMNWMWTGSGSKSIGEGLKLLDYLKSPLFKLADLMDFDLKAQTEQFDRLLRGVTSEVKDGWQTASVDIPVPDHRKRNDNDPLLYFPVPGLHFRDLTETIKSTLESATAKAFHFTPFRQFWQPADGSPPH